MNTQWTDVLTLGLRGLGWQTEERDQPFDRLPAADTARLETDLARLFRQAAGLYVDFVTAADTITARWRMDDSVAVTGKPHLTQISVAGLDLYGMAADGDWRWAGSLGPDSSAGGEGALNRVPFDGIERRYRLYLPLRSRVLSCEIGASRNGDAAAIRPVQAGPASSEAPHERPICYYGTSIVHGAGVDRPGMAHASQLGRALHREVLNLGVAGRARCEAEVAEALSRLDPALFVFDVLPNNSADDVRSRVPAFVKQVRVHHPETPVLLLGDREFGDAAFCPERHSTKIAKDTALVEVFEALRQDGCAHVFLSLHESWFGRDTEGTVDASHPNSLGAHRFAILLAGLVRPLLQTTNGRGKN